jgi:hypothetical protein
MAIPQRKPAGSKPLPQRPGPSQQEPEPEEQERPRSRADAFDDAEPESGIGIKPGSYAAHLVAASHEVDGQKESVKFQYEIYDGDEQGKTVSSWYNLFDKDGNQQRGIGFLKRDMEMMGQPPLNYKQLADQLQAVADERPLCNLTVKQNAQWTNIYLQGLAEGV